MTPYSYPGLNVESNESILNQALKKVLSIPQFAHLTRKDILGNARHTDKAQARHALRYYIYRRTGMKKHPAYRPKCNHATVINSIKRVENMEVGNPQLYKQIMSKL